MEKNIIEKILEGRMEPTDLPLELLREITDGFSPNRIIGEGLFGTVYKGIVGNRNVAVKRIRSSMTIDDKLFRREVGSLMVVNHQNVIRFLGLCSHTVETPMKNPESRGYIFAEIRERLLCFEYINNGSLDKQITDEFRGLEWDKRYEIIKGLCTGLNYLHMEKCILHMDLKPANILLDNDMTPKITDFGLSRPKENSKTMCTTHFFSPGYCAPENLFGCGRMSVQSDIYSLGVIIMELVTGHKGIPDTNDNILRRWRHRWNKSGKEASLKYHDQVTKCIEIGSVCQKVDPYARPSISAIMSKFVELESMDYCRTIAHESTVSQTKPPYWEDDMLGVEPLELQFTNSGNDKQLTLPCSVELSNNTDSFIAFEIQTTSPLQYSIEPKKDIVKPRSKCSVDITLPAANTRDHNSKYTKEFIVRSIKVDGLTTNDMNEDLFDKRTTGHQVDEIYLSVIFEERCNKEVTNSPSKKAKQYASSYGEHHVDWSNTIGTIGRELFNYCLVRLSRSNYGSVASLNHDFNSLVRNGRIYHLRRKNRVTEHWVYLSCDGRDWVAYDPHRQSWIQVRGSPPCETIIHLAFTQMLSVATELFLLGWETHGYRYSILTNSWTRTNGLNTPRWLFGSASDGEKAYVAGGSDSNGRTLRSAEMYDSETHTWIPLPSMNRARTQCSGVLMDGKFYVIGGASRQFDPKVTLTCGEEYDLNRRSWRVIENMADDGLIGLEQLLAVVNNELYTATDSFHLKKYDKMDGTWITLGNLPEQYESTHGRDIGFLACGDRLIVIGFSAGRIELHSWIPDNQPPVWTLLARRSSQYPMDFCAVMSC